MDVCMDGQAGGQTLRPALGYGHFSPWSLRSLFWGTEVTKD